MFKNSSWKNCKIFRDVCILAAENKNLKWVLKIIYISMKYKFICATALSRENLKCLYERMSMSIR
jgi:hypothetical protein